MEVGTICQRLVYTIRRSDEVTRAAQLMREKHVLRRRREFGLRRLPVVNDRRELVGILALDDVLQVIAGDAQQVVGAIHKERQIERVTRPREP